jgi:hypothetical protein
MMNEMYLMRSATAPETIVAAVPQNTSWKKNLAQSGTPVHEMAEYTPLYASPTAGELSVPVTMNRPFCPMKPLPSPNIKPQPKSRNPSDETAKTMKFFDKMFTLFLARAKPLSTLAKPRFMKNTSIPVTRTQIVSRMT